MVGPPLTGPSRFHFPAPMPFDRRDFLRTLGLGAVGASLCTSSRATSTASAPAEGEDGPILQVGENIAIAPTRHGRVRGFVLNGIYCFRGIPYGADTGGANRFLPPKAPAPWTEVRPALWWGPSAPQEMQGRYSNSHYAFRDHWNYDEISEDCLRLNVWTPALGDGGLRPVLVWLHGGGFVNGNAIEQDGYDGENFARSANAVFVSVNHRLGPLGYVHFGPEAPPEFATSGNVGMLDLVAALEWVRDHIQAFGGDPGRVTIMGQSGGGAKVTTLLGMPSARGLFHRAVALSGSSLQGQPKAAAAELGTTLLAEAGVTAKDFQKLQAMPWQDYLIHARAAAQKLQAAGRKGGYSPVADGLVLPLEPFFSRGEASVPLLLCTTFHENPLSFDNPALEDGSLEDIRKLLQDPARRGPLAGLDAASADNVLAAYARHFPKLRPIELGALVASNRRQVVAAADARVRQGGRVHLAWFGFQPPLFDGRLRAFHCCDISFWFLNTDRMFTHTGGGARPRKLAQKMAGALATFMATGRPRLPDDGDWPAYSPERGETLVIEEELILRYDPDGPARRALPAS